MSKTKMLLAPLPTKPAEVWIENRTNPKEAKAERYFAEIKFVVFQRQSNAITLDARSV